MLESTIGVSKGVGEKWNRKACLGRETDDQIRNGKVSSRRLLVYKAHVTEGG